MNREPQPAGFLVACAVAFCLSVGVTVHFCRSMCCEMAMPGGWTISMMWTRMPGSTWIASAAGFLCMWLAMMIAMMLPSALPTFLSSHRSLSRGGGVSSAASLSWMACGYFAIWLTAGATVYGVGAIFTAIAMRVESFSRAMPVVSGASLICAGAVQFTRWKTSRLLRCRAEFGCAASCEAPGNGFLLGCRQGLACCGCCAGLVLIQLALGVMNPLVMAGMAGIVAAEKLFPRPEWTVRVVGLAAIVTGIGALARSIHAG